MITVIIIMTLGIILGRILFKRNIKLHFVEKLTSYSIYLLLFLLGVSVGTNRLIIENFHKIGLTAVILSISAIAGSILLVFIVNHFFFRKYEK